MAIDYYDYIFKQITSKKETDKKMLLRANELKEGICHMVMVSEPYIVTADRLVNVKL